MKKFGVALAAMLMLALVVPTKADDPSEDEAAQLTGQCGEIKNRNVSYQAGPNLWLEYIAETARPVATFDCPWLTVTVEAYVVGISGSAHTSTGTFTATSRRQIPVPHPGTWQTNSEHYRNYLWFFSFHHGSMSSTAIVQVQDEDQSQNGGGGGGYGSECSDPETVCEATGANGGDTASPIIVDVDRDGYDLTSVDDGVLFDIDADGNLDRVAWTRALSEDAFLALDRNGNGRIDDGSELFGNFTPAYPRAGSVTTSNGFEALKYLENPAYGAAERNELLNQRDAVFARLLLWTDRNHNGLSETDELRTLGASGIVDIGTDYKSARKKDRFGNEFRQRARVRWADGYDFVYDIWLRRQ
jgi:hypothetical protein